MTAARKPKKRAGARRNRFDCPAYRAWIMRSIEADARSVEAAARRVTKAGATLH